MERIATGWDAVELWIAGLPFVPQLFVVLLAVLPICFLIARTLDAASAAIVRLVGRGVGESRRDSMDGLG